MVNDPAQQLLGLDAGAVGHRLEELMPAGRLRDVLQGVGTRPDDVVLTDDHALVVNRRPVILAGRPHGAVVSRVESRPSESAARLTCSATHPAHVRTWHVTAG